MKIKIAPSILTCPFHELQTTIVELEEAGADYLHMDIMDGSFVPNITFGSRFVSDVKKISKLPIDVHLMVVEPQNHIKSFAEAGAEIISIHFEGVNHVQRYLQIIKAMNVKAGVVLNPHTPLSFLEHIMDVTDYIMLMTVNPGFGGQKFLESSIEKIKGARKMIEKSGREIILAVDGGVNKDTAGKITEAGADFLVAGTAIIDAKNKKDVVKLLRGM